LAPDGRTLAYTRDGDIQLVDMTSGRDLGKLPSGPNRRSPLAFSPDGRTLASSGYSDSLRFWDVKKQTLQTSHTFAHEDPKPRYRHVVSLVYGPSGKTLAGAGSQTLWLWDAATGEERRCLAFNQGEEDRASLDTIALSPDGSTLAAAGRSAERNGRVRIWDTA